MERRIFRKDKPDLPVSLNLHSRPDDGEPRRHCGGRRIKCFPLIAHEPEERFVLEANRPSLCLLSETAKNSGKIQPNNKVLLCALFKSLIFNWPEPGKLIRCSLELLNPITIMNRVVKFQFP
ncbi:MAG: hypothetical protein OEV64_04770 [Desulfobulbaceae bacterium]|nr:hypothetical protein [Desulfobulbaceae bacterium]